MSLANGEEAAAQARAALSARLAAWGVQNPQAKAQAFIEDMARNGWRHSPNERPSNPTAETACRNCGGHVDRGCCDQPTRRVQSSRDPSAWAERARAALNHQEEA